jgi:hypothetical protein
MSIDAAAQPTGFSRIVRIFSSEFTVGALVALLSLLAALAAYQGSLADSQEGDLNVEGQKQLTEANSMYLEANQFIIYDFQMYDGWYISDDEGNEQKSTYYQDSFSESLTASMERADGPFDDPYYDAMYAEANDVYGSAVTKFEEAQVAGDKANHLQMVVLIYAVGLSLAAYASLVRDGSPVRVVFTIGAIAALVFGLTNMA